MWMEVSIVRLFETTMIFFSHVHLSVVCTSVSGICDISFFIACNIAKNVWNNG
jgi:hypothetical protein